MALWLCELREGPQRVNHAAVVINGFVLSFGGYSSGDVSTSSRTYTDVHIFNTRTFKWSRMLQPGGQQDAPFMTYGHTVVTYKNKVYLFGGRNDDENVGVNDDVYRFDPDARRKWKKLKTKGTRPFGRDGHTCTAVGNKMYLFGGFEDDSSEFCKSVYSLDLDTLVWEYVNTTGTPASWRDFHTATYCDGNLVVFGGRGDRFGYVHSGHEVYCNKVHLLNLTTKHWTSPPVTGSIPCGRRSHNAFEHRGKVYVFGGFNSLDKVHYNDLHCFDLANLTWSGVTCHGTAPSQRRRSACALWENKAYIFGGTSPMDHLLVELADTHILDLEPTLHMRSFQAVLKYGLPSSELPYSIRNDIKAISGVDHVDKNRSTSG